MSIERYTSPRNAQWVPAGPAFHDDTFDGSIWRVAVPASQESREPFYAVDPNIRSHRLKERPNMRYKERKYTAPGLPPYETRSIQSSDGTLASMYVLQRYPRIEDFDFGNPKLNGVYHDMAYMLREDRPWLALFESGYGFQIAEQGKSAVLTIDKSFEMLHFDILWEINDLLVYQGLDEIRSPHEIAERIDQQGKYGTRDVFIRRNDHDILYAGHSIGLGVSMEYPDNPGGIHVPIVYTVKYLTGLLSQMHGRLAEAYNFHNLDHKAIQQVMQLSIEPSFEDAF